MGRRRQNVWNRKSYKQLATEVQEPRLPARSERTVFDELTKLCTKPGYIHALAFLIYRDSVITAGDEFTKEDFLKIYSPKRLIRMEFSVLIGLMLKGDLDTTIPPPNIMQEMIDSSDRLMLELHDAILAPAHAEFRRAYGALSSGDHDVNPLTKSPILREAMFYGGESAFTWHYINFSKQRYQGDNEWLEDHRGFTIDQAVRLAELLIEHLSYELLPRVKNLRTKPVSEWTMLPCFTFTKDDLISISGYSERVVENFLDAYSVPRDNKNESYDSPFSANIGKIFPFIKLRDGYYTSLQEYNTSEAIYDNPYYWMLSDANYKGKASQNRGKFAESLTFEFLERIFSKGNVYKNVIFQSSKKSTVAEADALVLFGSRAFVFQIKSKRLTENAKAGDEISISKDFKSAVQEAYDQAISCIKCIRAGITATTAGTKIPEEKFLNLDNFYPVCITSEHYPALSFQVAQFLKTASPCTACHPLVFDLFTLDIITEFLRSPLYFVDYMSKRSSYHGRITSSHEMVILSYHLKKNLYIPPDYHFLAIEDDFLVELDLAVNVRRRGLPGLGTPSGILTRNMDTPLGRIVQQIDKSDRPEMHQIGEILLGLSGEAYDRVDNFVGQIVSLTNRDGASHDVSIPLEDEKAGLTIHCNSIPPSEATEALIRHCEVRKYAQKADRWFGLCLSPDGEIRLALGRKSPWRFIPEAESEIADFRVRAAPHWVGPHGRNHPPGRNSLCPCESGRKFKHCHGR